tara:strand:- start:4932 stop:5528 length:597 start_codon:yes stop_codon:yes gene_type:complete
MDANASARMAARQRWMEKDAKFKSESLKFFNREAQAVRGMQNVARGYSKGISNDLTRAIYVRGQALKAYEKGFTSYMGTKEMAQSVEEGRSRTAGRKNMLALLRAQGALENSVSQEFGANMHRRYRSRLEQMQAKQAGVINQLGVRPEYGAPVLMPPTDRLSGALSIASQIAGTLSSLHGIPMPGGDGSTSILGLPIR